MPAPGGGMVGPPLGSQLRPPMSSGVTPTPGGHANLADILERVLDKGIVIAGDIRVNLLDIELLTIKIRLIVASVDRAREMGIDWWEHDPSLSPGRQLQEAAQAQQVAEMQQAPQAQESAGMQQSAEVVSGPVIAAPIVVVDDG